MGYRRQAIVEGFRNRAKAILRANGFTSDAGASVFLGERVEMGPDDPDVAIAIVIGDDQPKFQGEHIFLTLTIEIQVLAKADLDEPWMAVEMALGDVKKAIELADRTMGGAVRRQFERGTTRTLPREPGMTSVGAGITYFAPYPEVWGNP